MSEHKKRSAEETNGLTSQKYFVGGNWKLNGTRESVKKLVATLNDGGSFPNSVEVVIAPTALHIEYCMQNLRKDIGLSAQNVSTDVGYGPFTGELSATLFKDWGINWTIAGHSERRRRKQSRNLGHDESEYSVANKTRIALDAGLSVIVCCGETLTDRKSGAHMNVIIGQLEKVLEIGKISTDEWNRIVIAYEPVWAIGTGVTASPDQAQKVHEAIRWWLMENVSAAVSSSIRIIYGGSVKPANAKSLIAQDDIDGFLVGGASLRADFIEIINSVPSRFNTTTRDKKRQRRIEEVRKLK